MPSTTATRPDPARWRILGVTLAVGFMSLLDVTIVNIALPSMRAGLDASPATIQWVVSGYALTFGLLLVTGGRLGDAFGRRRLMLIGLSGFVLASAACGLAPTAEVLIAARLLQGVSAGLLSPQNTGIIQQFFEGPERGRAFGMFGFTVAVSSAIGPLIGGLILAAAGGEEGWRWIFLVNIPIGLVLLVAIFRIVPGRQPGQANPRLDLLGSALVGLTVLCLLLPVVALESGRPWALVLLLLAPVAGWAFVRWEVQLGRRGGAPLLDVDLLRQTPGYGNGIVVGTLYFTGFTGVFLVTSIFLQDGLGYDALAAAVVMTPFAVGAAVSAPAAGRLVSRWGRKITVRALSVMMSGLLILALIVPHVADRPLLWLWMGVPLLISGLGGGGVISPNFTLTLAHVPPRMGGAAGGALQTGQRVGSAIGAAVMVTVYQLTLGRGGDPAMALQATLLTALLILSAAFAAAWWDLRRDRPAVAQAQV